MLINGIARLKARFPQVMTASCGQQAADTLDTRTMGKDIFRQQFPAGCKPLFRFRNLAEQKFFTFTLRVLDTGAWREGSLESVADFCHHNFSFWNSAIVNREETTQAQYLEALNRSFPPKGLTFGTGPEPLVTETNPLKELVKRRTAGENICFPIIGLTAALPIFQQVTGKSYSAEEVKNDGAKQIEIMFRLSSELGTNLVHPFMNLEKEPLALARENNLLDKALAATADGQTKGISGQGFVSPQIDPQTLRPPVFTEDLLMFQQIEFMRQAITHNALKRKTVLAFVQGPGSIAASVLGFGKVVNLLKAGNTDLLTSWIEYFTESLVKPYAAALAEAGADGIALLEPTPTKGLMSPTVFRKVMLEALRSIIEKLNQAGYPVVYHACGHITPKFFGLFSQLPAQVFSFDEFRPDAVPGSLEDFLSLRPDAVAMGQKDTKLFGFDQSPEEILRETKEMVASHQEIDRRGLYLPGSGCDIQDVDPQNGLRQIKALVEGFAPL